MAEETNLTEESIHGMTDDEFEVALAKADLSGDDEVEVLTEEPDDGSLANEGDDYGVQDEEEDDYEKEEEVEIDTEDEDLEQPTSKDSDGNSDEDEDEEDLDEDSEADEPTGEEAEEQTEDKTTEDKPAEQTVQTYKYKANGQEFEFTEKEVKEQFGEMFSKAMNYTQKMQALAPYKGILATVKEQGLNQDDLNLMVDVLKGDKDATAALLKRTGVDALDLETDGEQTYQPNNYGRNETELAIQEVVEEISRDPEYEKTYGVIEKGWDSKSRQEFAENPQLIKELHHDVKSGVFDKVNPLATKLKVMDGGRKPDIEYYKQAGAQYYGALANQQRQETALAERERALAAKEAELAKIEAVKAKEAKRAAKAKASKKRRAAGTTGTAAGKPDALDYMDMDAMSDEEFSKFMDKFNK